MFAANHLVRRVRCSSTSSQSKMLLDAKEALQEFAKEVWSWPSGWAWSNQLAKALGGENCRGSQRAWLNWSATWRGNCRNGRCNWQLKAICVLRCVGKMTVPHISILLHVSLFAYIQEGHFKQFEIQLPDSPNSLFILRIASYIWQRDNQIPSWILTGLDQNYYTPSSASVWTLCLHPGSFGTLPHPMLGAQATSRASLSGMKEVLPPGVSEIDFSVRNNINKNI